MSELDACIFRIQLRTRMEALPGEGDGSMMI